MKMKQNAFIIVLSLTISFSITNILITFISFESGTDNFHSEHHSIYRLLSDDPFEPGKTIRYIHGDMKDFLKQNYSEINEVCQVHTLDRNGTVIKNGTVETDKKMVMAVDSTFFKIFNFDLIEGSEQHTIEHDGIVLKKDMAQLLFGDGPYLNKSVSVLQKRAWKILKVTGVLAPIYENTQLNFDAIVSNDGIFGGSIFLTLNENLPSGELAELLSTNSTAPSLIGPGKGKYELVSLSESYFHEANSQPFETRRNQQLIMICWGVVALLCLTASFNFINLYITGLLNRHKELGIKRIFGAGKKSVIISVGIEVASFVIISFICSLILMIYLMPYFNNVLNTQMTISYFTFTKTVAYVLGGVLLLATAITIYLSLFVWRFKPIGLITDRNVRKVKINKFLFAFQFFISVGLVIGSFVIINQINYIKNKPLGFNRNIMQLKVNESLKEHMPVLKDRLLSHSEFNNASMSSGNPIFGIAIVRVVLEDGAFYQPFLMAGDEDLLNTMNFEIVEGGNINPQISEGYLVNETFINYFDIEDPIGKPLPGIGGHIAGVVKDFNCRSLRQEIPPFVIGQDKTFRFLLIDISNSTKQQALSVVKEEWKNLFPDENLEYKFMDEELMAHHKEDTAFFRMIVTFTFASLVISCFGLFGIATFSIQQRTKEIGVRKVMGASFKSIVLLIWKDYMKLIAISFVIAIPVVNYFLVEWLQEFAFRIELSWWLYLIPGLIILGIALLTISGQSLKAANLNPVESIKDE